MHASDTFQAVNDQSNDLQGGPSGRGKGLIDIDLKILSQYSIYKLLCPIKAHLSHLVTYVNKMDVLIQMDQPVLSAASRGCI